MCLSTPRASVIILLILLLVSCESKVSQKIHTIGIINLNRNLDSIVPEFKKSLAARGYIDSVNINYIYNGALSSPNDVEGEVLDLLAADIDVLLTMTTPATLKAKALLQQTDIPILFVPMFSPVDSGVVSSMSHPGENITGVAIEGGVGKALEWLLKSLPDCRRIWVPLHHNETSSSASYADLREAAALLGVEIIPTKISSQAELELSLNNITPDIDAVWLTHSHLLVSNTDNIVAAATRLKIPVASSTGQVNKGLLLSFAPSSENLGQQAGRMVDKILNGIPAHDLPIEGAEYFLSINLRKAKELNITIAENIISQADVVLR